MAVALLAAACTACAAGGAALQPASDRVEGLLARMTLDEKIGQLGVYAAADDATGANPLPLARLRADRQLDEIRAGRIGALFNGAGTARKREAQRAAVQASRLGIPLLFAADVIHGYCTVFPVPLAEAAAWDPALAERTARAAAVEAAADGVRWTFAPMVDITRDARWGRGVEGAGEDVLLGSRLAAARVRGFQGPDLSRPDALLATAKHFVAYGAAEGGLDYNGADVSERTVREVYLPPFRAAVDAGAGAVMTAFNTIAGVPVMADPRWVRGVLRGEWGFGGLVVSDYTADAELVAHGVAADDRAAAKLAFRAGNDLSMQSGLYRDHLAALVRSGEVPMADVDAAVRRVLATKERLGLFDDPMRGLDAERRCTDRPDHVALAREAAVRSIVLLRNEGELLPLAASRRRIALIGPFSRGPQDLHGPWTLFPGPTPPVSLEDGLRAALGPDAVLDVVRGSDVQSPLRGGIGAAVAAARRADVVLLAIGEGEALSGEARSRSVPEIPKAQRDLAEAVAATGRPVVVLLRTGRALALEGAVRDAQAIVVTWFLGSQTGHAVADVLLGRAAPGGRLPVSFPRTAGQAPLYYAHRPTGRPQPEDDPDAFYKARFLDAPREPLYPFGHGLGYGRIRYEDLRLDSATLEGEGTLEVRARLRNSGARTMREVPQLYVRGRVAAVSRPVRELKDFRSVDVAPGQAVEVVFTLRRDDLAYLGPDLRPVVEPGDYDVWVAPSAEAGLHGRFRLVR